MNKCLITYEYKPYTFLSYQLKLQGVSPLILVAETAENFLIGNLIAFDKEKKLYIWILSILKDYINNGVTNQLTETTAG